MMTTLPFLSQRINNATRPLHAHLNALIFSVLPLALPPHTSDCELYLRGIANILPIYEAFEKEFRCLRGRLEEEEGTCRQGEGMQEAESSDNEEEYQKSGREEVVQALNKLYLSELKRTSRLRQDISSLSRFLATSNTMPIPNKSAPPRLTAFTTRIHTTIPLHPHLLLAYTWIFYMALFSGGRYIRAQLRQAGPGFWKPELICEKHGDDEDLLSFWTFEGDRDGEDSRAEFKKRFLEVERCLTEREKEHVVQEAVSIMGAVIGVVEEIADLVADTNSAKQAEPAAGARTKGDEWLDDDIVQSREGDKPTMQWLLLKHILPLGMVELLSAAAKLLMLGIGSCKAAGDGEV